MSADAYAVILAGGKGERFWPLSTARRPKQVLELVGEGSLLAQAVRRLLPLMPTERILVITSADLVDPIADAMPSLPRENIVGEPMGRDTGAAVTLAAALVAARDPEGVMFVLTADQVIGEEELFRQTLREAQAYALAEPVLATIGIQPTFPSSGFGYIRTGEPVPAAGDLDFFEVEAFVEKPDAATAADYLRDGRYFWNSGMFIWSIATIQDALRRHAPALYAMGQRLAEAAGQGRVAEAMAAEYPTIEKISIDYAVMEHADNIVVVRGVFPWDDLGSWTALEAHFERDAAGNTIIGGGHAVDAGDNIVYSPDHVTALIGVDNLVVVHTDKATLVCPRDRAQDIKKVVEQLRRDGNCDEVL